MKKNIKYIILIILFILLVTSITVSILFNRYKVQGNFNLSRKRFDVVFTNTLVSNSSVRFKVDNDKKFMHIDVDKLDKEIVLRADIKNIGNIDAIIKNYSISNVNTNALDGQVSITSSINNQDVIKKGESLKLKIVIKNNSSRDDIYYNFNINYLFDEYNL